jgi:hypothetical protein
MDALLRRVFQACLQLNALLTRSACGRLLEQRVLTPLFIRVTRYLRGRPVEPVDPVPAALGREWERLLGDRRYARITALDHTKATAYGEITGVCPLRGTGDVAACDRLMAFDRGLMSAYGARFVVLASQAEPNRTTCTIAIRPQLLDASDLIAAHRRKRVPDQSP